MKLFLIDKNDIATIAREDILRDHYHYDIDYAHSYDEFVTKFADGKYHVVIVDFALPAGEKALKLIDLMTPRQRVIIISASEAYSEERGCAYCVERHNRRRLKKPFGVMVLANLIRDFDTTRCSHYHD